MSFANIKAQFMALFNFIKNFILSLVDAAGGILSFIFIVIFWLLIIIFLIDNFFKVAVITLLILILLKIKR